MRPHADEWISAYYDGELHGDRLAWVEEHLASCATCRAELEQLRRLSALLQSVPALADQSIPDRFTAQVGLRLSPASRPGWQRALRAGWQAAPLVLVLVWAFLQAVLLAGWLVGSGGFSGLLPPAPLPLPAFEFWELVTGLSLMAWMGPFREIIPWLGLDPATIQLIYLNLVLSLATGVLLWGWLASWWVYRTRSTTWITFEF
jgi:hypothetical protein